MHGRGWGSFLIAPHPPPAAAVEHHQPYTRRCAGLVHVMEKTKGWERIGELSRMLQTFRRMYVHREAEDNHPAFLDWRQELIDFLKVLYGVARVTHY